MNTPYIKKAIVKRKLLEQSKNTRAGKFTRVSDETLQNANRAVHTIAENIFDQYREHSSKLELIDRNSVNTLIIEIAKAKGLENFNPPPAMLFAIDQSLKTWCASFVHRLPSKGKTI